MNFNSGGRVVAGSNPVIPTIEQVAELKFCYFFCCLSMSCASPPEGQQKKHAKRATCSVELTGILYYGVAGLSVLRASP